MPEPTATKSSKQFQHDGKPVFVLIPQNSGYAKICQTALEPVLAKLENPPVVVSELKIRQMESDSVVYVMHPVKVKKEEKKGRYRTGLETHISEPLELAKVGVKPSAKGYRAFDPGTFVQAVTKACRNDLGGLFFRGTLTSESKKHPDDLLVKISES